MLNASNQHAPNDPAYTGGRLADGEICKVRLELVPVFWGNDRNDLLIRGYVEGNLKVDILFTGQRCHDAVPLMRALNTLKMRAFQSAKRYGLDVPDVTAIRLPASIEGSWQRVFEQDESGWETHYYNLIASQWMVARDAHAATATTRNS